VLECARITSGAGMSSSIEMLRQNWEMITAAQLNLTDARRNSQATTLTLTNSSCKENKIRQMLSDN
jgi:hypothetical protein